MKRLSQHVLALGVLFGLCFSVMSTAMAEEKAAGDRFEYNIYWRLGLNTSSDLKEDSDTQGTHKLFYDVPTSRHVKSPSYFWSRFAKIFANGVEAVAKVDSETALPHESSWERQTEPVFRVRDLYLQLPIDADSNVWAGSRVFEFEDIRLLDVLNHFNVNGYGVGANVGKLMGVLSFENQKVNEQVELVDTNTVTPLVRENLAATRKNVRALVRYEIPVGTDMAVKPMVRMVSYGSIPEKEYGPGQTQQKVKGASEYSFGGVFSRWSANYWGNTMLWIQNRPVDSLGKESGSDMVIGVGDSVSFTTDKVGVLTAIWIEQESYKNKKQVFKVSSGTLIPDGDKTTKSVLKTSLAVQPIYYVTNKVHAALDMNYAAKNMKTSGGVNPDGSFNGQDFNSLLVTPIVRYTTAKGTLGNPQIYTSVTYGKYDWKAKKNASGKPTDSLVTTQTGFEVWF